jgi:hypothetical protein
MNLSHLASGSYLIVLETDTERYSKQIQISDKSEWQAFTTIETRKYI